MKQTIHKIKTLNQQNKNNMVRKPMQSTNTRALNPEKHRQFDTKRTH